MLAHPLEMLCFLLPLIAFYELACLIQPQRVIAYAILERFLEVFGSVGVWAPGLAIVAILLATHVASGRPWTVRWSRVGWMYLESALACLPLLLVMNWAAPLSGFWSGSALSTMAQGVGAGVYEELVFRLALISLLMIVFSDLMRLHRATTAVVAVVLSAVLFAAHHHLPIGQEPFHPIRFAFRTAAGVYLALIFWYRGYALAAGCHASYNSAVVLLSLIRPG